MADQSRVRLQATQADGLAIMYAMVWLFGRRFCSSGCRAGGGCFAGLACRRFESRGLGSELLDVPVITLRKPRTRTASCTEATAMPRDGMPMRLRTPSIR